MRDSYRGADDCERAIHEYVVRLIVDIATSRILECVAQPGVLPAPECSTAKSSVELIVGRRAADLVTTRHDLTSPTTCTHLTHHLRALADLEVLIDELLTSSDH